MVGSVRCVHCSVEAVVACVAVCAFTSNIWFAVDCLRIDSVSLWKSDSSLVPRPRRYVRAPPAPTSTHFDAALRSGPMLTEHCADIKLRKEPASLKRLVVPW